MRNDISINLKIKVKKISDWMKIMLFLREEIKSINYVIEKPIRDRENIKSSIFWGYVLEMFLDYDSFTIYEFYKRFNCNRSYKTIQRNFKLLEESGLVKLTVKRGGKGGCHTRVTRIKNE